jgi:hypothetical protein
MKEEKFDSSVRRERIAIVDSRQVSVSKRVGKKGVIGR